MSERQLHEPIRVTEVAEFGFAVRSCEMEACSELQHRTKVNLQAGMLTWASGWSALLKRMRVLYEGSDKEIFADQKAKKTKA